MTSWLIAQESVGFSLRRRLEDALTPDEGEDATFDPKVFWSVNAVIVCIVTLSCAWYCCLGGHQYLTEMGRINSDEAYRQTVLERRQRQQEAKRDSPEKRRKKLLQSFQRTSVSMVSLSTSTEENYDIFSDQTTK
jgi:hypothetical protein